MKQAYWMWYPGDYEIYHALQLNCRREEHTYRRPAFWRLDDCWHNIRFRKRIDLEKAESMTVYANGIGNVTVNDRLFPFGTPITLEAGEKEIIVICAKTDGLPSVYVEGESVNSGPGWEADSFVSKWHPAGFNEMYTRLNDNPEVFPFAYETISYTSAAKLDGGILYDFGKEIFAKLCFEGTETGEAFPVYYGESVSEALDIEECYLRDCVPAEADAHTLPARAFRYVFIPEVHRSFRLTALYEYLPLQMRGSFQCSDEKMNRIWQIAAYTFHLNSREFFLDGIKRDRWIWSGDAYQSYLINYYLFFDQDIVKRTMLALRGKDPVEQHINTILDYSLYWIMGIGDYYRYTGDLDFIRMIWDKVVTLLNFCMARRNLDGFIVGLDEDWVFVDWHESMDKTGALCAEQMLFIRALETAIRCANLLHIDSSEYEALRNELRGKLDEYFWDEEKGAYIDSYSSGKRNVTRHANLFAILFNMVDEKRKERIISSVIDNEDIPPITTPYFKFYELEGLCLTGHLEQAYREMTAYWGGMLDLGATTIWEEYDPSMSGDEHYAMYGRKFHKSLCHAWGASPIYLLERYFLGVSPTSDSYETFVCKPNPGTLEWMRGSVPIKGGTIDISFNKDKLRVYTDCMGGTLVWKGQEYELQANKAIQIDVRF